MSFEWREGGKPGFDHIQKGQEEERSCLDNEEVLQVSRLEWETKLILIWFRWTHHNGWIWSKTKDTQQPGWDAASPSPCMRCTAVWPFSRLLDYNQMLDIIRAMPQKRPRQSRLPQSPATTLSRCSLEMSLNSTGPRHYVLGRDSMVEITKNTANCNSLSLFIKRVYQYIWRCFKYYCIHNYPMPSGWR